MAERPGPLTQPLVAHSPSGDLFDHAKDLFVEAKLPGLGQCAAMERPAVRPSVTRGRAFCEGSRVSLLLNCRCHMRRSGPGGCGVCFGPPASGHHHSAHRRIPKKAALHSATAPYPQPNANAVSTSSISPETKK
jgi:hypothetical protein